MAYARLNRRTSILISRQLTSTRNMVSIFTLELGLPAGFFAYAGYWSTLLGAFLCLFASIPMGPMEVAIETPGTGTGAGWKQFATTRSIFLLSA